MTRILALVVAAFAIIASPSSAQLPGMQAYPLLNTSTPQITTPVFLGCAVGSAGASSVTVVTVASIPSGSLVVAGVISGFGSSNTITGVSDGTNSYALGVDSPYDGTGQVVNNLWYKENASAVGSGANLVASFSGSSLGGSNAPVICAAYTTNVITSSSLDKTNFGKTNNGTVYASGSTGTLTQSNEIAFGFLGEYNASVTITEGSGFTSINNNSSQAQGSQGSGNHWNARLAYQIVSSTTALNYQPSTSANTYGAALIATFKGF